jgi:hypothetical protein
MFYEPQRIKRSDIGSSLACGKIVPEGKVLVTALVGVVSHFQVKAKKPEGKPAEHSSCTWHVSWHVFAICAVDSRLICGKRVPGLQIIQLNRRLTQSGYAHQEQTSGGRSCA